MNKWMIQHKKLAVSGILGMGLLLSACGSSGTQSESGATAEAEGPVETEFWYGLGSNAGEKMEELITEFNESQDQYIIKGVQQADYSETYQNLQAAIASDTAPGLVLLGNAYVNTLGDSEALAPLDSYISETEGFNQEDFLPAFMEQAHVNDTLYALPAYGTTQVMYYRSDIFEEAGVDPEEAFSSWENLLTASEELQAAGAVDYGFAPMWGSGNLIDIALSNGGQILNEAGDEVMIDSPEWIEAWEMVRKAVHEDETFKLNSGGEGWEYWYRTIDEVMQGSVGGYLGSSGDKGDLDFEIIDSMVQPGMNGSQPAPVADALYLTMPSSATEEEQAAGFAFAEFFTSVESQVEWTKAIGYIPVRESTLENEEYATYIEENPAFGVPFEQAQHATPSFLDPTGGQITDALTIAADKVELENIPAEQALKEVKEVAQEALDAAQGE